MEIHWELKESLRSSNYRGYQLLMRNIINQGEFFLLKKKPENNLRYHAKENGTSKGHRRGTHFLLSEIRKTQDQVQNLNF